MTEEKQAPDGVIFDFDGVIVDTEPLHWEAFRRLLSPMGIVISWEDYLGSYVGFDDRDVFRVAFDNAGQIVNENDLPGLISEKAAVFERLVSEQEPTPFPGVLDLIRLLAGTVPLGLCSGALRCDIDPIFAKLDIASMFDAVVTADDVHVSKPDPASYVLAIRRLGEVFPGRTIRPERCVAVEDTPAGVAAANGAGLRVLALPNTYPDSDLSEAARVVDTLDGLGLGELAALVNA